jgi:hypothetical protein
VKAKVKVLFADSFEIKSWTYARVQLLDWQSNKLSPAYNEPIVLSLCCEGRNDARLFERNELIEGKGDTDCIREAIKRFDDFIIECKMRLPIEGDDNG